MKVLVSVDSFKGSLSSMEAGNAVKEGILKVYKDAQVDVMPLADGGEGTVEALVEGMNGVKKQIKVKGPLLKEVIATYGILENSNTAIMEMAEASGITLISAAEKDPLKTTTFGVGEMIKEAISHNCRNFIVGIGGSATNDGGIGMLQALGFEFLDENKNPVGQGGEALEKIAFIETKNKIKELDECNFKIACDVNNPLYGERGATAIYGPQKGVTPELFTRLDAGMINFANICEKTFGVDNSKVPGVGAAGGLGFGFLTFLNATLKSGVQIILEEIKLEDKIKDVDIVITGEGRLDNQTAMGKAPIGVAKLGKKYSKKVLAFAGCTADDATECNREGIDAYFPIVNAAISLEDAMDNANAHRNMVATVEQVFNLIKTF
ncbi:glycerate kinase [Candidatus Epulonipiscium fishelsonii]|uniref:Glycerate kinase n=1 Tax=Candidatus Epulonipiscium fishelsonii TaxID=77094 RepID=A0ACC8XH69_9FIRM|nr:glycerate kinase [Epulopiscium sp. SCG-B05WGA-EpuloA1]ONI43006.1 glycerate kinase [Epulopiscium sp. SCG-B11WGA-EpuloA1]